VLTRLISCTFIYHTPGLLSIRTVLETLRGLGIRSVMVEGGAKVIGSFFAEELHGKSVVDTVIITVAPSFVGEHGVGYNVEGLQVNIHSHFYPI
jgi:2,5-diamino-6-(ribosylamino)-4(3H)-pyrimidinone 5'-phosphate reductase